MPSNLCSKARWPLYRWFPRICWYSGKQGWHKERRWGYIWWLCTSNARFGLLVYSLLHQESLHQSENTETIVRTATSTSTCKYRELGEWSNTFNFVNICWELEASDILTLQHAFKLMESRSVYTSLVISLNQMWTHYSSRLVVLNWGWSWPPQGTLGKV